MAIVSTKNVSSVKLSLDCGLDDKGKNRMDNTTLSK